MTNIEIEEIDVDIDDVDDNYEPGRAPTRVVKRERRERQVY